MQILLANGVWEPVKLPYNRNPYNLTSRAPYEALKNSTDIRRLMLRRPPAIELLTEEEAMKIFEKNAREQSLWILGEDGEPIVDDNGKKVPDTEAALEEALEEQRALMLGKVPGQEDQPLWDPATNKINLGERMTYGPDDVKPAQEQVLTEDDIITPKVMGILRQVAHDIPPKEKKPAKQVIAELKLIPNLSMDDYEYIRAKGHYSSVKNWANKMQENLAAQIEEDEAD